MKYKLLCIKIKTKAIDALAFHLSEIGINSLEIVDNNISEQDLDEMFVNINGLDSSESEYSLVKCYFDDSEDMDKYVQKVNKLIPKISEFLDVGAVEIFSEAHNKDYLNEWKKYYKVVEALDFAVVPEWQTYEGEKEQIIIEPGYAFGSGSHETTRLCLEMMQTLDFTDKSIADIGCGSGILCIAAKKLGASRVLGIDIDEMAIKASENNMVLNGLQGQIELLQENLLEKVDESFDIIVSNIILPVLISMKEDIKKRLKAGGILVLSGILESQKDEMKKAFGEDFKISEICSLGEWLGVILKYE